MVMDSLLIFFDVLGVLHVNVILKDKKKLNSLFMYILFYWAPHLRVSDSIVRGSTWKRAFVSKSQMILIQLAWESYFENH